MRLRFVVTHLLAGIEAHAALTQALAAIVSVCIAAFALVYAVRSLHFLRRQTEVSTSTVIETFRPVIEVLGGALSATSKIDFTNKGNGAALNFRWREDLEPPRWRSYRTNIIAPLEKGVLEGQINWSNGLVLSYNSVTHREEILTYVKFLPTGAVSNQHEVKQGAAVTRMGWTLLDPKLAVPGYHPDLLRRMPHWEQVRHWYARKRGRERLL